MTESGPIRPLAVVTGASSGIGSELARQLADNGFDLVRRSKKDDPAEVARQGFEA